MLPEDQTKEEQHLCNGGIIAIIPDYDNDMEGI